MNTQKRSPEGRFSTAKLRNPILTKPHYSGDANLKKSVTNTKNSNTTKLQNMTNLENSSDTPKTTLVVIPLEQLTEIMKNVVQLELKKHQAQNPHTAPEDEFLNATETIAFLRVSRPTYQKLRHNGQLPAVMASDKRLLFKKSDLIAYLNSRKETSN